MRKQCPVLNKYENCSVLSTCLHKDETFEMKMVFLKYERKHFSAWCPQSAGCPSPRELLTPLVAPAMPGLSPSQGVWNLPGLNGRIFHLAGCWPAEGLLGHRCWARWAHPPPHTLCQPSSCCLWGCSVCKKEELPNYTWTNPSLSGHIYTPSKPNWTQSRKHIGFQVILNHTPSTLQGGASPKHCLLRSSGCCAHRVGWQSYALGSYNTLFFSTI